MSKQFFLYITFVVTLLACSKTDVTPTPAPVIKTLNINSVQINGVGLAGGATLYGVSIKTLPVLKIVFSDTINPKSLNTTAITLSGSLGSNYSAMLGENPKTLLLTSNVLPTAITNYTLSINSGNNLGGTISAPFTANFVTQIDSTAKFPALSDEDLLTKIQQQTLRYFIDYAHPISGMARERLGSDETVTTGGTGFGLMAILAGINRGFVTHANGYVLINKIVAFLNEKADKFHGAFPHWMNGSTGKVIPFSTKDDGGDLVETAFLMQGLLTVNEYFKNGNVAEKSMCDTIQKLWKNVEWDWYRQSNQNTLYWHWSPNYAWAMNMPIAGYDEALIVYVLASASPTHSIPKTVYELGWAKSGAIRNGKPFEGVILPLGSDYGGPLFFAHYSFLGLNPRNLKDQYADYWLQNVAHSQINNRYCIRNPLSNYGYSADCWGLTASDIPTGYTASSPTNDVGTIAPTAALSSFPYTPAESMKAARFFYYQLGDKLWGDYGMKDAFNMSQCWFASSYLAIDQGPIVVMIENYRTQMLWNLFMQNSDVRNGLISLGFTF